MLQRAVDLLEESESIRDAAAKLGVPYTSFANWVAFARAEGIVSSYISKGMNIPNGIKSDYDVLDLTGDRTVLVINDVHVPYHDEKGLEMAIQYAQERDVNTVFINGDFIDLVSVSDHEKTPSERSGLNDELETGRLVLKAIREEFSDAEIYYNEGNHETRMPRYLAKKAPELFEIPGLSVKQLLKLDMYGIKWIPTETDVRLGDLNIFHGHEYRGGGLLVARSKFLQAMDNILFANFHRTQEYIQPDIQGKVKGSWAVACMCDLRPRYMPKNNWNLGFAVVHSRSDGHFVIENKKIIDGKIY